MGINSVFKGLKTNPGSTFGGWLHPATSPPCWTVKLYRACCVFVRFLVRVSVVYRSILPDTSLCYTSSIQILIYSSSTAVPILIRNHCSWNTVTKRSTNQLEVVLCVLLLVNRVYCCSCFVCVVTLCVFVVLCGHLLFFTLDAGLLARSQYSEGPATGHLDTGFSWFPCA